MRYEKRGISPLIATVLLIGFAVALAAIVMTWGIDFIGNIQEGTEKDTASALLCASDLDFEITNVQCPGGGNSLRIMNKGNVGIDSFIIVFKHAAGSNTVDTGAYSDAAPPQGAAMFAEVTFDHTDIDSALITGVHEVEARARIKPKDGTESQVCTSNVKKYIVEPTCL